MSQQHSPAAISFYSKIIEYFAWFFGLGSFFVLIPYTGDDFSTGKASYWYHVSPV